MDNYKGFTDEQLISLLKEQDHAAFAEIHRRYFKELYRSASNVLNDTDACMDIIQDVFTWFWEHRAQHSMQSIKGYLLMAIKYQAANYIRKGKIRENFMLNQSEQLAINEESLELQELQAIVDAFAKELPDKSRLIFKMSKEQHLSNKEIAARLGITEKTVSGMLARALKKLKGELGKMNFWIHFFI
ncbi:RNA polymerase sigma-70 factor [Pedobacter heparinus]|uniref:RNA polymerase sigma-70 factor n=1 Tax=Pedobacter heparinus TaxID=984 RepID=UPI00292E8135|nr:RNA polymerase sigma-70 factor [Pedobacter heparinus]